MLWNTRCALEKQFCECTRVNKTELRQQFIRGQRNFDKGIREAKRIYWHQQQIELLEINQKTDFWKKSGQIGIHNDRSVKVPWEIVQDDGTISVDQQIVLNKWMCSFKELLNTDNGNSLIPTDDGPSDRVYA